MEIKALAFDVFGTVVDWRGTIASEGARVTEHSLPGMRWDDLAEAWMKAYGQSVRKMTQWVNLDVMLERAYPPIAKRFGLDPDLTYELASVWSRLRPWPDAVSGFGILKSKFTLAAFTNANALMLDGLEESTGLPWDYLLTAESVRAYKPDPRVYRMAIQKLGRKPEEIMLVAAHCFDLNAARSHGMRTALITREGEPGSDPSGLDHEPDIIASDIDALATELLARRRAG